MLKLPSTTYAGQITDSVKGAGTARVTLTSAAGVTSGTWEMAFGGRFEPTSVLNGTLSNNEYTGTIGSGDTDGSSGSGTPCNFSLTATMTDASFIGNYKTFAVTPTCPVARTATFNLTRQ